MAAVFLALTVALLMQQTERGIVFGFSLNSQTLTLLTNVVRRFHGYVFIWAIVFTFWYHPVEAGIEHLSGFFIILLFTIQACLMYTTAHLGVVWRTLLELQMLFHAVLAEIHRTHRDIWKMFVSGSLAVFVITQMHAFPLTFLNKSVISLAYILLLYFLYYRSSKGRWKEIFNFPVSYYFFVIAIYIALYVAYTLIRGICGWPESSVEGAIQGGFHPSLVVCGLVLILITIILLFLIGELFEKLFRHKSSKAGVPSAKVNSLLQNPDVMIHIERMNLPRLSMQDVQKHNTVNDCWLAINGMVYDVTEFVLFHPGGKSMLLRHGGTDASKAFRSIKGNTGHPKLIRERMRLFACGVLHEE